MPLKCGTCGWSYDDWKGSFYPPACKDELAYYASLFPTVEIDSTWYRIPSRRAVESWHRRTPPDFIFCPKMPGEITHDNLLRDSDELVTRFLSTIDALGEKLGPMVVQLSPQFASDQFDQLAAFLRALPTAFRYAVEFRHGTWVDEARAFDLIRDLNMGLVMAHHPWYPRIEQVTNDTAYIRLMGPRKGYPDLSRIHRPRDEALTHWAELIRTVQPHVEQTYVFINNHFEGHSPESVRRLVALLSDLAEQTTGPDQRRLDL